jgi:hypothetical protein
MCDPVVPGAGWPAQSICANGINERLSRFVPCPRHLTPDSIPLNSQGTLMSLSDLASLGSFVSGIAVLVSLIYLAIQVRQAEKNQRAIIHQGRAEQSTDRLLRFMEPELLRPYMKGLYGREASTEELEFQQFVFAMAAIARETQDLYFQHDLGFVDEASLRSQLVPLYAALSSPGGKTFWKLTKGHADPRLKERVDALDASLPVQPPAQMFSAFKAELAKSTTAA